MKKRRFTVAVVAIWVLALALTTVFAPAPAEAEVRQIGWMVFTPNHPAGCAPLAYDCYVIVIYPD